MVKFSVHLNRRVFVMATTSKTYLWTCAPAKNQITPCIRRSLIRIFTGRICDNLMRTTKTAADYVFVGRTCQTVRFLTLLPLYFPSGTSPKLKFLHSSSLEKACVYVSQKALKHEEKQLPPLPRIRPFAKTKLT